MEVGREGQRWLGSWSFGNGLRGLVGLGMVCREIRDGTCAVGEELWGTGMWMG